ncbi:MAG: AAA family ATPase [Rhodobacteraceae bacterium]|nr:AAA family ATPase [Paracoccaceae bacterium]MCY4196058.1 AAA family ATPase [Paracoccaceae bacterium]MCY4326450.1 AAA family ATPase [Paracoccaceae bacterium]
MLPFRQRWQSGTIRTLANERRILLLTGSRQCGKTTLSKNLDLGKVEYRTLDNKTQREAAVLDPHSFLIHRGDMLIIDEVQRVPSLLPAIKQVVDEDSRSGQFLLTGSAHVQALPSVQESLAGRIANIRLRPLSEGEIREAAPRFLERAFAGEFNNGWADCNRDRILATALRGGFPEVIDLAPGHGGAGTGIM